MMDQNVLQTNLKKLIGQKNGFLLLSALLALAVVLLSFLALSKKERIVIVPTSGTSYWIEEDLVSSGYLEKMGFFLSDLLLNRSRSDVEKRNEIVLQYVHPSSYHEMRKLLLQEQESILKGDQAFYFHPENSFVDGQKNAFVTEGEFFVAVKKEGHALAITQKERKKYTFRFVCENGKLLLTSLKKEEA